MGRHTAADGASAHPLVAAALEQRAARVPGPRRGGPAAAAEGGDVGWPVPPAPPAPRPDEGPVGWPGSSSGQDEQDAAPAVPRQDRARRGWRWLFGTAAAA